MSSKHRRAYHTQKGNAKRRGIEWKFTYETWIEWWGEDIERRGPKAWQLQMQRIGDCGPYSPENVRKGHPADNSRTAAKNTRHSLSVAARARIERELAELPTRPSYLPDYMSEDEDEIDRMFKPRTSLGWAY